MQKLDSMLSLTTMMSLPTLISMKPTENIFPGAGGSSGIGQRRHRALYASGHKVITAGRRPEVLNQTTDANPGAASVTLDERRSVCASL